MQMYLSSCFNALTHYLNKVPQVLNFYNIVPNSLSFTLFQAQMTSPKSEGSLCIYNLASEVRIWL